MPHAEPALTTLRAREEDALSPDQPRISWKRHRPIPEQLHFHVVSPLS
jgi:hypothetical protein